MRGGHWNVISNGRWIKLENAYSLPQPIQQPHPPIIGTGTSDTGLAFTVSEANACFLSGRTHEEVAAISRRAKQMARAMGKTTLTYQMAVVIPGETMDEGYNRHLLYADGTDMASKKAGLAGALKQIEFAKANGLPIEPKLERRIALATSELTFPDLIADLNYFGRWVMPELARRGLAEPFAFDPACMTRGPALEMAS